ncbi:cryptochrome-1-like [Lycorma delicatula]
MWMWLSCSSFFQQFFHCYCPVRFGRKADPNGDFIRRYIPVLKNFPGRWIHEPWNAPLELQKRSKCIIGKDYSLPMVNHAVASRINMERMRQVYQQLSKYRGNSILKCVQARANDFAINSHMNILPTSKQKSKNESSNNDNNQKENEVTLINNLLMTTSQIG